MSFGWSVNGQFMFLELFLVQLLLCMELIVTLIMCLCCSCSCVTGSVGMKDSALSVIDRYIYFRITGSERYTLCNGLCK